MKKELIKSSLDYHRFPEPGKIEIAITKSCATQNDLRLAYTPGVAEPIRAIVVDPNEVFKYTAKGNLVAVITDGTAVLGLGNVGPMASKPVMEGKAVLFKKFADIDVFDIEVDAKDSEDFINTVVNIAPTFGGVNLEDIAAPECFDIEQSLIERLDIPVFHDDQHGTAVIIAAGLINALELQKKNLSEIKLVCLGAGAAAIASMRLLCALGLKKENIRLLDRRGVIHSGRDHVNRYKKEFAVETDERSLVEAVNDADVLIGLSGPDLFSAEMVRSMAARPIVFALSNPEPEILPEDALAVRNDLIMATGRSDYPNQVNNVLGFPFIFRGALDVRASCVHQDMLIATVKALAAMAKEAVPQEVLTAYNLETLTFGPEYIIPKPLDPRLIDKIPPAVAHAAVKAGVARLDYPSFYPVVSDDAPVIDCA